MTKKLDFINDSKLSWGAKGLLYYLLSLPASKQASKKDIIEHASNGETSINNFIKELRAAEYVALVKVVNAKGEVDRWIYKAYDTPLDIPVITHLTVSTQHN